jgi:hypothetical protein
MKIKLIKIIKFFKLKEYISFFWSVIIIFFTYNTLNITIETNENLKKQIKQWEENKELTIKRNVSDIIKVAKDDFKNISFYSEIFQQFPNYKLIWENKDWVNRFVQILDNLYSDKTLWLISWKTLFDNFSNEISFWCLFLKLNTYNYYNFNKLCDEYSSWTLRKETKNK